ncbi:5'/3'-nucleotidase SurE [Acerihabitans sp. KWT182]|uniref:5'-nucleotidase n=1 Tax=Acerihabitans sp. KWT182 TaxID=3157919 RepID=A0AAU7QBA1_9GAMM
MKIVNRVLLTNDDGFDAPGLALLAQAAEEIAEEVWIVAPSQDKSGVANSLSMREPVRVVSRGVRHFAVYGTPRRLRGFRHPPSHEGYTAGPGAVGHQ